MVGPAWLPYQLLPPPVLSGLLVPGISVGKGRIHQLCIKNEEVLVFYDSSSNGHLIEGQTAELLDLDVLSCETVPIGGLGGKVT